jgi:hypothetical protein
MTAAGEARRFWPPPQWLRFHIELVGHKTVTVDAVGMGIDGSDLVFFSRWSENGGIPLSNRVPRVRVLSVTTDVAVHDPLHGGSPPPLS